MCLCVLQVKAVRGRYHPFEEISRLYSGATEVKFGQAGPDRNEAWDEGGKLEPLVK